MKKVLIAVLVLIAIGGLGLTVLVGKLDGLIADAIRTEGSAALGTAVTVDSVKTKIADGVAIINGLAIANPVGYKSAHALRIDSFSANVDYKSQSIGDVIINKPVIHAELIGTDSNFQSLLDGLPEDEQPTQTASSDNELVLSIKSIQIRQATVNIDSDQLGITSFPMDDLVMNDLSGTVGQLSEVVTNKLISHIKIQIQIFAIAEITKQLKEKAIEKAKEELNEKVQEKLSGELGEKLSDKLSGKLKDFKLKLN